MAHRISSIVPLLFITLLCVGSVEGGYLMLEYFLTQTPASQKQDAPKRPVKAGRSAEMKEQKHDYHIILSRNLFGPPPSDKVVGAPAKNDSVKDLAVTGLDIMLKGTISGEGKTRFAIITEKINNTQQLYQEGDAVQGAFVKEILRGKVILSYNGKDEVLEMSDTAGKAAPSAPIAVAPRTSLPQMQAAGAGISKKSIERIVRPHIVRPGRRIVGSGNNKNQPIE